MMETPKKKAPKIGTPEWLASSQTVSDETSKLLEGIYARGDAGALAICSGLTVVMLNFIRSSPANRPQKLIELEAACEALLEDMGVSVDFVPIDGTRH